MPGGKQRRPGFLLAILLQGKRDRKTSQPPGPVRVELTAPDGALWARAHNGHADLLRERIDGVTGT
jgi:hypothetical protein